MTAPRSLVELAAASDQEPALLADLARSGAVEVRVALAGNAALPTEVAARLAKDRSVAVRRALAASGPTAEAVVERVVADRDGAVRTALLDGLTDPYRGWYGDRAEEHRAALTAVAERLAADVEPELRARVARLLALPATCHAALAADPAPVVREALASNPKAAPELLVVLIADPSAGVAAAALGNPLAPAALVEDAAGSPDVARRAAAAGNPIVGRERAVALLADDEPAVAAAAAGNPRVPLVELARLYEDLPRNPPSHKGAMKPYAPTGALIDFVEDRLARSAGWCGCGRQLATERFEWGEHRFAKAWCMGGCGRDWRLDVERRYEPEDPDARGSDGTLRLFQSGVTDAMVGAGAALVEAPSPPDRFAPFLEPFAPLVFDRSVQLPLAWGFPIVAWAPDALVKAIEDDLPTIYLTPDRSRDHALWCARTAVLTRSLDRAGAAEVYGPYGGDAFEDVHRYYGPPSWRSVTFGEAVFSDRQLAPDEGEERQVAEAGWRERVARERVEHERETEERLAAHRRDEEARRAGRAARTGRALELLGGPVDPPEAFADCLGRFGPVSYDGYCGEVVDWGFPVVRRVGEERWKELGRQGELAYVNGSSGGWHLICRSLTREIAIEIYGPVTAEDRGPRGGWRSVTLGETTFATRLLA